MTYYFWGKIFGDETSGIANTYELCTGSGEWSLLSKGGHSCILASTASDPKVGNMVSPS
jgi:hypothetical protein